MKRPHEDFVQSQAEWRFRLADKLFARDLARAVKAIGQAMIDKADKLPGTLAINGIRCCQVGYLKPAR